MASPSTIADRMSALHNAYPKRNVKGGGKVDHKPERSIHNANGLGVCPQARNVRPIRQNSGS